MTAADPNAQYARIIARAWADPAFKEALLADPTATLAAEGLTLPEGVRFKVVENAADVVHLVLPPKPDLELSDDDLDHVTGGLTCYEGFRFCCTRP